jgi:hypothetical protein
MLWHNILLVCWDTSNERGDNEWKNDLAQQTSEGVQSCVLNAARWVSPWWSHIKGSQSHWKWHSRTWPICSIKQYNHWSRQIHEDLRWPSTCRWWCPISLRFLSFQDSSHPCTFIGYGFLRSSPHHSLSPDWLFRGRIDWTSTRTRIISIGQESYHFCHWHIYAEFERFAGMWCLLPISG